MFKFPGTLIKADLVKRVNRFVAEVIFNEQKINVYVPNTGRLSELAIPGNTVLLSPLDGKYKYKILYIIHNDFPVMIDSTYSNRLFYNLLSEQKVPCLEPYSSVKREPVYGNHRFDFLLEDDYSKQTFIELKSCTLFHNRIAAFPDAISSRATEHVKALAETGIGKLVFFILKNDIERFVPNYHTDFTFYETLKFYNDRIDILAFTVQYGLNLEITSLIKIPVVIPEVKPHGMLILLLYNQSDISADGKSPLKKGYYVCTVFSEGNIFKTAESFRKKNGIALLIGDKRFSDIKVISVLPVVGTSADTESIKIELIDNGGICTDLEGENNTSALNLTVYFRNNPADQSWFWDLILELRFNSFC